MADVQKEIALKVTTDTTQTQSALKGAEDRLNEAKKRMIELAVAGKQNTEEFRKLAQEAGTLKGRLELVEQTVDGIGKSANKIEVFSGAVQGIAASFALAQGAASLFAEGDEELQQAFVKTQAALAILAGTEQAVQLLRKESAAGQALLTLRTKAYTLATNVATATTKSFGIALAATGIGLAVVALGFLIQKFMETKEATKAANDELEIAKQRQDALKESIDNTIKSREQDIKIMQALGATDKQIAVERIADIGKQLEAATAAVAKEREQIEKYGEFFTEKVAIRRKQILEEKELAVKTLAAQLIEQQAIIKKSDDEAAANRKKYEADRALALQEITNLEMRTAENTVAELLKIQQKGLDEELLQLMEANGKGFEERQKALKDIADLDAYYRALKLKDEEDLEAKRFEVASAAAGALSSFAAGIAAEGGKNAEKAFKISKSLAIVQATIDTIRAAQLAFNSVAAIPIAGIGLGIAAAAAATVAGIARVNQIRKQQFNAPSSPTNVPTAAPSLGGTNVGGNVPGGFDPQSTNLGGFSQPNQNGGSNSNGASRVIVVERDIRNVANRVNSTERFATFG
jgi:hypothetical protein